MRAALIGLAVHVVACGAASPPPVCRAPERPLDVYAKLEEAFPNLPDLDEPTGVYQAPTEPDRFYVLEKKGTLVTFTADRPKTTKVVIQLPVDTYKECGLLGLAFDPAFERNHHVSVPTVIGNSPSEPSS